jgi:hypothetical protein
MQVNAGEEERTSRLWRTSLRTRATCAHFCCDVSHRSSDVRGSSHEAEFARSQTPVSATVPTCQTCDAKRASALQTVPSARQSLEISIDGAYGSYQLIPGLSMDALVGTGAYATVYKGTWLSRQVAVKVRPCRWQPEASYICKLLLLPGIMFDNALSDIRLWSAAAGVQPNHRCRAAGCAL